MTNKEILANMPCGEIVPKRILAAMKRKGLIYDYSAWGYLENCRFWYKEEWNGREISDYVMIYLFPKSNSPKVYDNHPNLSREQIHSQFGNSWGEIEYLGNTFEVKYLSGCFSPYLVKIGPKSEKSVNRSMSLWGAIC